MILKIYQVDAFTSKIFSGNPAAVCPLDEWLPDELLQKIAMENNLAETAYYVKKDNQYELRWFTPTVEVDLCGHATLASAFVLFNHEGHSSDRIDFVSPRSGHLPVNRKGDMISLNFPIDSCDEMTLTDEMKKCFSISPTAAFKGGSDYLLTFKSATEIHDLVPDFQELMNLEARGVICTAPGKDVDFVSRFFAPKVGLDEDPVTGSAHTTLAPFWANNLGKTTLIAKQLSSRGGDIHCTLNDGRVDLAGEGKLFMMGEIVLE